MLSNAACLGVAALAASLLAIASASITEQSIPGLYARSYGANSCPEEINVDRSLKLIPLGKYACETPPFELTDYTETDGNAISMHIGGGVKAAMRGKGSADFGPFMIGRASEGFNCTKEGKPTFSVEEGTFVNFFTPNGNSVMDFKAVFSKAVPTDSGGHSAAGEGSSHKLVSKYDCGIACSSPVSGSQVADASSTSHSDAVSGHTTKVPALNGTNPIQLNAKLRYMTVGGDCLYYRSKAQACFPADATVQRIDGARVRMDELQVGDQVATGRGSFSPVIMWTHRDATAQSALFRVSVASGASLALSPGHYIYANGKPVPAVELRVGDVLRAADGAPAPIVAIDVISASGLYNPQTSHGDIAVDGIVATTYTTAVAPPMAHALLSSVRSAFAIVARASAWTAGPLRSEL